ncbi:MAG: hypothetical protein CFH19_00655 [Alphaproteobacteria bacterium MarineAlpha5_Bin9]|nr:MAG: hypothetical protein CFH19_00655 [Alphaproteobacteria bacterium MarineAlpha5_Bin9]|tara:strand:- start:2596 stop:3198 length:603 start_codon:yes stop_codon:yes gene_type:complete
MKFIKKTLIIFFLLTTYVKAQEVTTWLQSEVDNILNSYKNSSLSNLERFNIVEKTVNSNFAGAGIAKFVAGKAWASANEDLKKEYIKLFKKHLALNIASMMQGYADQSYNLIKTEIDESNQLILIDMEILDQNNSFVVTWRIKESKGRFFVIDLIVADISLVLTKRSEFNSMLKKVDYDLENFNISLKKQNELSFDKIIK